MNLRAAQLNGRALGAAVESAIGELQSAVRDLRELANGLQPAILGDAGLGAAIDELPLPVLVEVTGQRFPPQVEATAWFIVCEAITNAVKHADASRIEVSAHVSGRGSALGSARDSASQADRVLVVRVDDDGCGGADASGSGLRGIADRAEAVGGRLTVVDRPAGGTSVTGKLPCE